MTEVSATISAAVDAIDPSSAVFGKAFPHLVPGVLRRPLSTDEIRQRALSEMWNIARLALQRFDCHDNALVEKIVDVFMKRAFGENILSKFDPARGTIDGFLYGVMRRIALECLRSRSRERLDFRDDPPLLDRIKPSPAGIAEQRDLMVHIRQWTKELAPNQRNAVARRYEVLADLDSGGPIPNEFVARHRGLARLRRRARESEAPRSAPKKKPDRPAA